MEGRCKGRREIHVYPKGGVHGVEIGAEAVCDDGGPSAVHTVSQVYHQAIGKLWDALADPDEQAGPTNVDVELEYSQIDVAVGYRFLEVPVHDSQLAMEAKVGTRWQYISLDLDLTPGPSVGKQSRDFQELLVGGRAILKFNERASFAAAVDFSGFGIGSGSRLTWNLELMMRYKMTESTVLGVGYRLLDVDFASGSGASRTMLDAQFSGPVLGVGFLF